MTLTLGPVIGQVGGGEVEEIPVSMSGAGGVNPVTYPLTTVDAGSGSLIVVAGALDGPTTTASRPHLRVGTVEHDNARSTLAGPTTAIITNATGTAQIAIVARNSTVVTFTGTVYVARL
ncbi:hypothetical protein K3888_13340 [Dietzia aurantiaca]|uniref:hypothetical protein n=1 Tax=Dietzia aurantiaca TaxID=983873 RepID=UPI001E36B9DA|nr:hypothetical protein [Dietzia aurantiaca]MCD2263684.1 hypothetical protein [Dietzia aurantiaca]